MKKKFSQCIAVLLALLLLGGCGGSPVAPPTVGESEPMSTQKEKPLIPTSPPKEQSEDSTDEATEPLPPPRTMEPVTRLTCVKWDDLPRFLSLGDGKLLASKTSQAEGKLTHTLDVIDVYEDQVVAHEELEGYRELVEQSFSEGQFILRDPENGILTIYDRTLQRVRSVTANNAYGYFSRDLNNYFYVDHNVLYRMDVATGSYGRMALQWDLRLESLTGAHPQRDVVVARFYVSFHHESTGVCAIDCKTGKILLLNDSVSHLQFNGSTFYALQRNDKVYGSDVYYGNIKGGVLTKASADFLGDETVSYTLLGSSGLMVLVDSAPEKPSTVVYDFSREGICSRLERHDYCDVTYAPVYLSAEQLIAGACPDEGKYGLVMIDPKVLAYEKSLSLQVDSWPAMVDKSIILKYQSEAEGAQVPEELVQLRQQADALEKKYGVGIRLGNQTLDYCGNDAAVEKNADHISAALGKLEEALAAYPEDFFRQFQNKIGEGGIWFWLTGQIDGPLKTVGKAVKMGSRYDLILDIRTEDFYRTVHHELWHAIEMKLSPAHFRQWNRTNPEDFRYYNRYDQGYEKLTQWTFDESGKDCWFVDPYSRINAREDRARLMETVMSTDATALMRSEALQKKLRLMADAIASEFDTSNWASPRWAQYI